MKKLIHFLYAHSNFFVFIALAFTGLLLVARQQSYPRTEYLKGEHYMIGSIYNYIHNIKNYSVLHKACKDLMHENAALRAELMQVKAGWNELAEETSAQRYACIPANIINNSIISTKNYLTIDKGARHGLFPGMGVISAQGIVGKIQAVSDHFATITSLLHTDVCVSAQITSSGVMGTVRWSGKRPGQAQLLYVPRHVPIHVGDTVVTSGYNAIFDQGALVGHIKQASLRDEALFHDIVIDISTDFSTLRHVYVVQDRLRQEKDSLERYTKRYYE